MNLTNTSMYFDCLPDSITKRVERFDRIDLSKTFGEETFQELLKESRIFDATQTILPRNVFVPNIGWNSVIDRYYRNSRTYAKVP